MIPEDAIALTAGALLSTTAAHAQEPVGPRIEERRPPALLVQENPDKASTPLRVVRADFTVTVVGNFASATILTSVSRWPLSSSGENRRAKGTLV